MVKVGAMGTRSSVSDRLTQAVGRRLEGQRIGRQIMTLPKMTMMGFAVLLLGLGVVYLLMADVQEEELASSELSAVAADLQNDMLQHRRAEKDFFLRRDMQYVDRHEQIAGEVRQNLSLLGNRLEDPVSLAALEALKRTYAEYLRDFKLAAEANVAIGLSEVLGLEGALRRSVHDIEDLINARDDDTLLASMLMLRRHEKDFIMRRDEKYLDRHAAELGRFQSLIRQRVEEPQVRETMIEKSSAYGDSFAAYAATVPEEARLRRELSAAYAKMEPVLTQIEEAAAARSIAASEALTRTFLVAFLLLALFLLGVAAAVAALGTIIGRLIVEPIESVTKTTAVLAGGEHDIDIPATHLENEIGEMSRALLVFKDNIVATAKLHEEQKQLLQNQTRLMEEQTREQRAKLERSEKVNKAVAEFDSAMSGMLADVASAADQLASTSRVMTDTASRTAQTTSAISSSAQEAASSVQTTATATEELHSSISEVVEHIGKAARTAERAVENADRSSGAVRELSAAAGEIENVINLIQDVAGRTNLLALNATIEAARAGEAGRGFAVVANEVKTLASQVSKATANIAGLIGDVQTTTRDTAAKMSEVSEVVGEISGIAASIASAAEQQGSATLEIARSAQEAAQGTERVTKDIVKIDGAVAETGSAAEQVLGLADNLAVSANKLSREGDDFLKKLRAA